MATGTGKTQFTKVLGMGDGLGGTESVGQTFVSTPSLSKAATPIIDCDRHAFHSSGDMVNAPHISHMEAMNSVADNLLPIITNNGSNYEEIDTTLMKFDHQTSDPLYETAGNT